MNLENLIEGILFIKGEPVSIGELVKLTREQKPRILEALDTLGKSLQSRGIVLVQTDEEVTLATAQSIAGSIEVIQKEELNKELSKASLETLSIILYMNGATRSEIDYVRGVNSSFILRNLMIRGLINKKIDEKDTRRFIYTASIDALSFLGVQKVSELPQFDSVSAILKDRSSQTNDSLPEIANGESE